MSMGFTNGNYASVTSDINVGATATIMFWFKPSTDFATQINNPVKFEGNTFTRYCTTTNLGNKLSEAWDNAATFLNSATDLTAGNWLHVTLRRTSTTNMTMIFNANSGSPELTDGNTSTSDVNTTVYVGRTTATPATYLVAQVRIWTVALSDGEITAEYNSVGGAGSQAASLWARWPLANGTDTSDTSGHNRTLTLTGNPTTGPDDPPNGATGGLMWL